MKGSQRWQAETADQALVAGHDVSPARACALSQDQDASRVAPSEPQPKRPKRGNYVSKACGYCQRRKIKCDGGSPCHSCVLKGRDCQRKTTDMRGRWRETSRHSHEHNRSTENELLSRVSRIEHQLSLILRPEAHTQDHLGDTLTTPTRSGRRQLLQDIPAANSLTRSQGSTSSPHVPTFSGETSLTHNITMIEGRLEQMGVIYERLRSNSPGHSFGSHLTPSPEALSDHRLEWGQTSYISKVLDSHRVVPNKELWIGFMRTFCEEVHILVPFLHIPTLWTLYEETWEKFFDFSRHDHLNSENRIQVAHILLCLANGKCVESSRLHSGEEQYSAGWSLYSAGKDIFGDLLDSFHDGDNQIIVLQTITLMVVYLFRLDAHGPAEKVLALTISHAHHIGLHRRKVVDGMGTFESEMCRRLWWCVYVLDRRLALETGRPFLIQDVNVDVGFPHDVSDEWLRTCHDLQFSVSNAASCENICSPVAYLIAMTAYSKVIGKVWEALYGASTTESTPSYFLNEYLMHLITQSQREIRREFTYDPYHPTECRTEGLVWWQVKQKLIMRIRWSSLHLLIRKPMLHKMLSHQQSSSETIENEVMCMHLARCIIEDFSNVPEEHPKYTFPFLHYLTGATIIALGLIIKQPSFKHAYGDLTLEAARSLENHCRMTWVSGRMARAVRKLNQMANATLGTVTQASIPSGESHHRMAFDAPGSSMLSGARFRSISERADQERSRPAAEERNPETVVQRLMSFAEESQYFRITREPGHRSPKIGSHDIDDSLIASDTLDYNQERNPSSRKAPSCGYNGGYNAGLPSIGGTVYASPIGSRRIDTLATTVPAHAVHETRVSAPDPNAWLPGEMIGGGMEWLQTLFTSDLDTYLPPVWD